MRRVLRKARGAVKRESRESREGAPRRTERAPRPVNRAPADPFFDQPYQPSLPPEAKPNWEGQAKPAASARGGLSPNIKPRKKVAVLFQRPPETVE